MRTTVELPDELFRAAKIKAARSGESLKQLIARALETELNRGERPRSGRAQLPLVPRQAGGAELSIDDNAAVADVLDDDDSERYGGW